jgi:sugar phosphate isomerase/epimerase
MSTNNTPNPNSITGTPSSNKLNPFPKIGIDSYSYHRLFGEYYEGLQIDIGQRISIWDFLERASAYGVAGVSLESCFFSDFSDEFVNRLRNELDRRSLERVWAWGHPNGLHSGRDKAAAEDLARHLAFARRIGASVMRICGGGRRTRPSSWNEHKNLLIPMLTHLLEHAERQGVVMAIENHIDFLADELVELITAIDSKFLRVCLDTGNALRMLEDPLDVVAKLAPFAAATHIKDVAAHRGDPKTFSFWPSVPLGQGIVDLPKVIELLHRAGYQGFLALEIDYLHPAYEPEEEAISLSLEYLRTLMAS